jgi:hypothetical protein
MKNYTIETDELDASDVKQLAALAQKLAGKRKEKLAREAVPVDKRVYVMNVTVDSMMTTRDGGLGMSIKGEKECEYLLKQLERRYGRKFYMEEIQ